MDRPKGGELEKGIKILVCDDDPEVLALNESVLRKAGYDVIRAATGRECLESVYSRRPDIVLLDVMLPDIRGDTLCGKIKADPRLEGTFVILTSGIQISSINQAKGLQIGADGYIAKPVSNKELVARIQAMERIKKAEDALREKERQQEKLIAELQAALAEIKTLKGFIPICASCKKIRDDEGYWNQLEAYLSKHTDAIFSHGLCPQCADRLREEVRERMKGK